MIQPIPLRPTTAPAPVPADARSLLIRDVDFEMKAFQIHMDYKAAGRSDAFGAYYTAVYRMQRVLLLHRVEPATWDLVELAHARSRCARAREIYERSLDEC